MDIDTLPLALYLIPTPLGNLGDFSARATHIVKNLRHIGCEDTRVSAPFLKSLNPNLQLFSAFEHVENRTATKIIEILKGGESVGLVTDAGTPAISDPGAKIVKNVRSAGFQIISIPGACAAVTAFAMSGFLTPQFFFYGFLPPKTAARIKILGDLKNVPAALIFYESPHRILESVKDLAEIFPKRKIFIARELTKMFEESAVLTAENAAAWILEKPQRQKGEFVVIVDAPDSAENAGESAAQKILEILISENLTTKTAAAITAKITGFSKNELYQMALNFKNPR